MSDMSATAPQRSGSQRSFAASGQSVLDTRGRAGKKEGRSLNDGGAATAG